MSTAGNQVEFVITRVVSAPLETVYKSWTEAERLVHWWGPAGFVLSVLKLEVTPGGVFHYGMKSAEGYEMWGKFTYRELTPPSQLVYVSGFADEQGYPVRHPMAPHWPLETLTTLTLTEDKGFTTQTLRATPLNANELEKQTFLLGHSSMTLGFGATFNQQEAYLAKL